MKDVESLFLDTNVVVYAHDRSEPVKGPKAKQVLIDIMSAGKPCISSQVLAEFVWAVTRKIKMPLTIAEASVECRNLHHSCTFLPVSWDVTELALDVIARHATPWWDAIIVATAKLAGAKIILSEDFQHRQTLEGVLLLNPFASDFNAAVDLPH